MMTSSGLTRRNLLAGAAFAVSASPALLGGEPVRKEKWPSWPVQDETEEKAIVSVLKSGRWGRGNGALVNQFEEEYARFTQAKYCLTTASGTSALITVLGALGIGPGDEVIIPPYTFIATVNAVELHRAKPVYVDSDLETFQIDAAKIEAAITPRTKAIMPVHLGGASADLDTILSIAKKRNIPVIEDACQAHLGQWRERQVGTYGLAGCFSFQASKNLNSGEGGAILSNNEEFIEKCYAFHNNGRGRKAGGDFNYQGRGMNGRLTEFQAALLLAQMARVEEQARLRSVNALYLSSMLTKIPGISPQELYGGCTRNAWHLYMFRYDGALSRDQFIKALRAEGIPCSSGYGPMSPETCPVNNKLCSQAVWFTQTMMLDTRRGMEQIAEAIAKIEKNASAIKAA